VDQYAVLALGGAAKAQQQRMDPGASPPQHVISIFKHHIQVSCCVGCCMGTRSAARSSTRGYAVAQTCTRGYAVAQT